MPNNRDRLNRLIDTFFACVDIDKFYLENQKEKLADWLRENGVIAPPRKIGDVVYIRTPFSVIERKVSGFKYSSDMKNLEGIFIDLVVDEEGKTKTQHFTADRINDCIFFTRGEAEKALKEGVDNAE